MDREELIQLFDEFINEHGLFYIFKEWVEDRGYTLDKVGIKDEE
jgi:hypothetical protein